MFYFEEIQGKKILKSDYLSDINAFFTTKSCCIFSKETAQSDEIEKNRQITAQYLGLDKEKLITCTQTHSSNVEIAKLNNDYPNTDALIVTENDFAVYLNYADCTPVILYDEKQNIGAVIHAGWRGTAQKISQFTAKKMIDEYSSNPQNIIALIGPCISQCCFNVGEDVAEKLAATVKNGENFIKSENDMSFANLKGLNKSQLEELGIERIDICPYCTVCDNEYFYSYRKENKTPLRHSAVLVLNNLDKSTNIVV